MLEIVGAVTEHTLDPRKMDAAKSSLEWFLEKNPATDDHAFMANQVGSSLDALSYFDLAAECFQLAFRTSDPYNPSRANYAGNFIGALARAYAAWDDDPEIPSWFPTKKAPLEEAIRCVAHFKNDVIFEEGYYNPKRDSNGEVVWQDQDRKARAEHLTLCHKNGADLLGFMNEMLPGAPESGPAA
jgi:hypothetical protein